MKKTDREPIPKKRMSAEERIRELLEESDEQVTRFFQRFSSEPIARRPASGRLRKRDARDSSD